MDSSTLRTGAWVAAYRLMRGWVDPEARLLLVREPPIETTGVVSDEVNASRSKKWERVRQELSRESLVSAFLVYDEQ